MLKYEELSFKSLVMICAKLFLELQSLVLSIEQMYLKNTENMVISKDLEDFLDSGGNICCTVNLGRVLCVL